MSNISHEAGGLFGLVGCGHGHGEMFTDPYDATVSWGADALVPETGAAGTVTNGGSGTTLDARVISVPNVNNPLLGLAFSIGGATT